MNLSNMPKKKKKTHLSNWKVFLALGFFFVVGSAFLKVGLPFYAQTQYVDSSLNGDEIIEEQQNTIPSDVVAAIVAKQHVLGANTNTSEKPQSIHVPILMYHYVEYVQDPKDTTRASLNTTPATLAEEIKTLQGAGYTFMTNRELSEVLDGKTKLPAKPILLTFDDGYRDFYTDAYPILKKYHVRATQYVIAGFLDMPNHLTTSQLNEIANDELVEIGAHTVHHLWLKGLSAQTVTHEVTKSKQMLEQIIHKPVSSFAYPFGAFDQQAVEIVEKAGFTTAVATVPGIDQPQTNRYFLYRLRPGGRLGNDLLTWLATMQNN